MFQSAILYQAVSFKKKVFIVFFSIHVLFLGLNGLEAFYLTISEIDKKIKSDLIESYLRVKRKIKIPSIYSKYTGINTGYGFFSPNVKGTGFIALNSCDQEIQLDLLTFEGKIRMTTFNSNMLDDILTRKNESRMDTFRNSLHDLIYYQLALNAIKDQECISDSISIVFQLNDIARFSSFMESGNIDKKQEVARRYMYEVNQK
jgi:hypothetical protein